MSQIPNLKEMDAHSTLAHVQRSHPLSAERAVASGQHGVAGSHPHPGDAVAETAPVVEPQPEAV